MEVARLHPSWFSNSNCIRVQEKSITYNVLVVYNGVTLYGSGKTSPFLVQ